jgi:hypothetical protein
MPDVENHIHHLFQAELQFRLASAVRIATTSKRQPLDVPTVWIHGQHEVPYEEIALRQDQAEYAAMLIQQSTTLTMAAVAKDAIEALVPKLPNVVKASKTGMDSSIRKCIREASPKQWKTTDDNVAVAYHIARLVRNAFAHAPFAPTWKIHPELQNCVFIIDSVVELNTGGLDGTAFDWKHYGGPLALLRLCQYVRHEILNDPSGPRIIVPPAQRSILQQGNLILEQVDAIPPDAVRVEGKKLPDGSLNLGGGHSLRVTKRK